MAFTLRRRSILRLLFLAAFALAVKFLLVHFPSSASSVTSLYTSDPREIKKHGVLDLVSPEKSLDARKHQFLQVRLGRDEREDLFSDTVRDGVLDYWERFQKP